MDFRKLQVVGNRSYSLSLPKKWVVDNKLDNHDKISIETTDNNELVLRASKKEDKLSKEIKIKADDPTILSEFMVFCYMKNIERINFYNTKMDYTIVKKIRRTLNYLEGYDITSETESNIDISFLFKEVDIKISKIIHRMYYLIRLQLEAIINKDDDGLEEAEIATDRLYFLATRILFACMQDYNLRTENGITHIEDLFFIHNIVKRLESIADYMLKMKGIALSKADHDAFSQLVDYINSVLIKKEDLKSLKLALGKMNFSSKNSVVNTSLHRVHDLCKDLLEARISMDLNEMANPRI